MSNNLNFKFGDLTNLSSTKNDGTVYVAKKDDLTAEIHVDLNGNRYKVQESPAGSELGLVKSGGDVTITNGIITAPDITSALGLKANKSDIATTIMQGTTSAGTTY